VMDKHHQSRTVACACVLEHLLVTGRVAEEGRLLNAFFSAIMVHHQKARGPHAPYHCQAAARSISAAAIWF
jgi:hypothetical protein